MDIQCSKPWLKPGIVGFGKSISIEIPVSFIQIVSIKTGFSTNFSRRDRKLPVSHTMPDHFFDNLGIDFNLKNQRLGKF